jgi:hypothetical protein
MQEKLRELRTTNDPFWAELNLVNHRHTRPVISALVVEDLIPEPEDEEVLDDSGLSLKDIVAVTHQEPVRNKGRRHISKREDGRLMAAADADDIDAEPLPVATVVEGTVERENAGKGKRQKTANQLY